MFATIASLAWTQHGVFTTAQAEAAGVSRSSLARCVAEGTIHRVAHGVYILACAPRTTRQALMIHLLAAGPGSLATADSALALWCPEVDMPRRPVIAVNPNCGYRSREARVVRSSDIDRANPGVVDGIPVVSVARALLDASVGRSAEEVVGLINACQRHLPLSTGALIDVLHSHARPGRTGITSYRAALIALTREVPDSEFERLVIRDLVRAGVEEPRLHHVVRLPDEAPIELDLDWPGLLLDVELDGRDHMVRMRAARRDRHRDRALQAVGYQIPRYTWADYLEDGTGMISEIGTFVAQHRARKHRRRVTVEAVEARDSHLR